MRPMWVCAKLWAVLLMAAGEALPGSPQSAVRAAARDAATLPARDAKHTRYLTLYAVPPGERADFLRALSFHLNSLSRESEIAPPLLVGPDLVRVSFIDYGWDRQVWEKLAASEPHFHARLVEVGEKEIEEVVEVPYGYYDGPGGSFRKVETRREKRTRKVKAAGKVVTAPACPGAERELAALALLLNSEVPVVRADWFLYQTSQQVGRNGAGYYDFLGLKTRADGEKLAGLDVAAAKRLRKEVAAIVQDSGVALNNRQVLRYQSLTGGYWLTLDANASDGKRNAVRLLNGDFTHDAEEHYGVLPNELFFLLASNANGELQDTVPDNIAGDHASTNNDRRIHPGVSCVRCHVEGLRPIDDYARKLYAPGTGVKLASPDPRKLKRLRQLYLSDLPKFLARDQQVYADALLRVNGLTPARNAALYARAFSAYADARLDLNAAAREVGCTPARLAAALKEYARPERGGADPVLVSLLAGLKVRREHFDETALVLAKLVSEYKGAP